MSWYDKYNRRGRFFMNEQDKRAVEGMARCGISLEGLVAAFPKFSIEDLTEIYNEINRSVIQDDVDIQIKMNCS